jgi:hypothetical protein
MKSVDRKKEVLRVLMIVWDINGVRECEGSDLGTCENDRYVRDYEYVRNESM